MSTAIEWTDETWNPTTGCTKVSAGCDHCYIERTPPFRMAHRRFDQPGVGGTTGVKLHSERLDLPQTWRKPRRVFVNSLSDVFHKDIPDQFIAEVFATMARTPQHTYQLLTKRPGRMRSLLGKARYNGFWDSLAQAMLDRGHSGGIQWPLPNVWLGVSVESQEWANLRVPHLLATPAAVRWLSCEPLLGPVDVQQWMYGECQCMVPAYEGAGQHAPDCAVFRPRPDGIDWVVVGGESGPGARPMEPAWARSMRDQCVAAGVPFFFKQWGEWAPNGWRGLGHVGPRNLFVGPPITDLGEREEIERVGKKKAGRLLDGRTWDECPAVES